MQQPEAQAKFQFEKDRVTYYNNPEYQKFVNDNNGIKEKTIRAEKETAQLDVLNNENQYKQQTSFDRSIQEKVLIDVLSATLQAIKYER